MKEEMERLNTLVDWYKLKLNEIREAPVDDRPQMLERLYRISEKNKRLRVTITRAGVINLINYPDYPPELELHECEDKDNPFMMLQSRVHCLLDVNHLINSIISRS